MGVWGQVRKGRKLYGVGINDAEYVVATNINGKRDECPYYRKWRSMLSRCYSRAGNNPTYDNISVCEEWLTFSNFKSWLFEELSRVKVNLESQWWNEYVLDKDIYSFDSRIYCPDNCTLVSQAVNNLLLTNKIKNNGYPIGVCFHKGKQKIIAACRDGKKSNHLGQYEDAMSAHKAWQKFKLSTLELLLDEGLDERIIFGIKIRINILKYDIDNGLETIKL